MHSEKSVLEPTKKLKYLGFGLKSDDTTVTLPAEIVITIYKKSCFRTRKLAQVVRQFVAAFPAVQWGPLYYRQLEKVKSEALNRSGGNFEAICITSFSMKAERELKWWIQILTMSIFPWKGQNRQLN